MSAFDIVIVGSGFAGSLLAMIARRLGRSVALLERGKHPRFAIGESSTPLANLLLEQISDTYDLPQIRSLSKWGPWQRNHSGISCGRKRGFSFFHHTPGKWFAAEREHANQLLVAANPNDELADTHWYRPDFDAYFVEQAQEAGATYLDQVELNQVSFEGGNARLEGRRTGQRISISARFLVDATGPRGFLHRQLNLGELPLAHLAPTQALFTHFRGVRQLADLGFVLEHESPPYPIDEAAVHHVFEGGWVWVLQFNNGLTSAGIAAMDHYANRLGFRDGANAWDRLLARYPAVGQQFADARPALPFMHMPRVGFRSAAIAGANWALLPSAAGFVDPLLSTGFALTLLGVRRLAGILGEHWAQPSVPEALKAYADVTETEFLAVERLVAALYASMHHFPSFAQLTSLYFGPVSFCEIAHRLGRGELASSFLLSNEPGFGPACRKLIEEALPLLDGGGTLGQRPDLVQKIRELVATVDVVGLNRTDRRNWYPCSNDELVDAAPKLGVSREHMERFLARG